MKKHLLAPLLALATLFAVPSMTSCVPPGGDGVGLPLQVAVGYRIPDTDLTLVLRPSAKTETGYSLDLQGSYKGLERTATGWTFTSPNSGITYEVDTTTSPPTLRVIGSGEIGGGVIINPDPVPIEPQK